MVTIVLNTNIEGVVDKIPDTDSLVKTAVFNAKIEEIGKNICDYAKYFTTPKFNKFAGSVFDTTLKQANLVANSDVNAISQLLTKIKGK